MKQHIVSETYLKHFSQENNGKGIKTLHLHNSYKKNIETHNSGDRIFWFKNFYNSSEFNDPKTVELFLGQKIENEFDSIIAKIKKLSPFKNQKFKTLIFQWVFYSKLRSPMWRKYLQFILSKKGFDFAFDSKELREEHMHLFSNLNLLDSIIDHYSNELIVKKWKILISPNDYYWITSDNPGFSISTNELLKNPDIYEPNPLWTGIQYDTVLYFPLTKEFCLEIIPYNQDDDIQKNFENDFIIFENSKYETAKLINNWTVLSSSELIISCRENELIEYEKIIKNST